MVSETLISEAILTVVAIALITLYGFWLLVLIMWFIYKNSMATRPIQGNQLEPETADVTQARGLRQRLLETDVEISIVFDTYTTPENSNDPSGGSGCAICLEEYKDGETRAARTACDHTFHADCIMSWLSENDTCPLCRNSLRLS